MPRYPRNLAVLAALAAPLLGAGSAARAQSIDLTRATCADFSGMNGNDQAQLSLWLAGYFAGGGQKPLLDLDKIIAAPAALQALCGKSPQLSLLSAETRAVFAPAP
ncbi:hypothetical protein DWF00_03275 [Bosea caraganae]|uniref:HdeA/HdeB family protein n=1 Tax=Bosea caraganae TaxID=2763117 RepID=A0A370L523_9HYPH|nr:HdeA/HdeB family chaperone [Bosea caraganae]RDJ24121.1 hypothetical protein DWE98_14505 [Bosea caraganae]RDJ30163.1 hypothetical protein DWF00_03275 [Bosea caraganae]